MNIYKQGKVMAVSAVMLLGLAACNTNDKNEAMDIRDNRIMNVGDRDVIQKWDRARNRTLNENGRMRTTAMNTSEILQLPDGFLTIDPNSYSTSIPSSKFPHMEMRQGKLVFEDGQQPGIDFRWDQIPFFPQAGVTVPAPYQGTVPNPKPQPRQPQVEQPKTPAATPKSGTTLSNFESRVIELTNEQRRKNGLPNLQPDTALSNVAQEKSNDMQAKHYFSHTSPTYGSPFDMMRDFGVTYKSAGENIAMGQQSADEVVTAWMNSEGHRKNILSPNFTHIGVGHTTSGNYWTQMFIGK